MEVRSLHDSEPTSHSLNQQCCAPTPPILVWLTPICMRCATHRTRGSQLYHARPDESSSSKPIGGATALLRHSQAARASSLSTHTKTAAASRHRLLAFTEAGLYINQVSSWPFFAFYKLSLPRTSAISIGKASYPSTCILELTHESLDLHVRYSISFFNEPTSCSHRHVIGH
jgi:hypothetical protein